MARKRQWVDRIRKATHCHDVPAFVRRVIVAVIGGTILVLGLALMVLPGPAIVVIPVGLAILGTEFVWARRWLRRAREMLKETKDRITR
jgi:tellurite resistance protein TerC